MSKNQIRWDYYYPGEVVYEVNINYNPRCPKCSNDESNYLITGTDRKRVVYKAICCSECSHLFYVEDIRDNPNGYIELY